MDLTYEEARRIIATMTEEEVYTLSPEITDALLDAVSDQVEIEHKTALEQYSPQVPWPKQREVLNLQPNYADDEQFIEIFFGGAAGPGKTSLLAMAALQFCDVEGFRALILRKTMPRLEGSVKGRLREWLKPHGDVRFREDGVEFPSGARIDFGYMRNPNDRFEYQGREYQLIEIDEGTEIHLPDDEQNPLLFLLSRLRRPRCSAHRKTPNPKECYVCRIAGNLARVPLRMIITSNPGGVGRKFIDKRYLSPEIKESLKQGNTDQIFRKQIEQKIEGKTLRSAICMVPALLKDNPAMDRDEYLLTLSNLPLVTRKRLVDGDWTVTEDGRIDPDKIRFAQLDNDGNIYLLNKSGTVMANCHESQCYRFVTCDPAGTSRDKANTLKGRTHSETAIGVFDQTPKSIGPFIVTREIIRDKYNFPQLCDAMRDVNTRWNPFRLRVENEKLGQALVDELRSEMPIDEIPTRMQDKITRAGPLENMIERGEFFLVEGQPWTETTVEDMGSWTGNPEEEQDLIDMLAYAAIESQGKGRGLWEPSLLQDVVVEPPIVCSDAVVYLHPMEADETKEQLGGLFVAGVRGDSRVYVDCRIGHYSITELLDQFPDWCRTLNCPPARLATSQQYANQLESQGKAQIVRANVFKQCRRIVLDSKTHVENGEGVLGSLLAKNRLRIVASEGGQVLTNRIKAYPHDPDCGPIHGLFLVLALLSSLSRKNP